MVLKNKIPKDPATSIKELPLDIFTMATNGEVNGK